MLSAVFTLRYIISWITDKDSFLSIVHVLETSNFCNNKIFLRLTISSIISFYLFFLRKTNSYKFVTRFLYSIHSTPYFILFSRSNV